MSSRNVLALIAVAVAACQAPTPKQCPQGMTKVGNECLPVTKPAIPQDNSHPPGQGGGLRSKAEWSASATYATNDLVSSGGVSYICQGAKGCTGIPVTNSLYWQQVPPGQQPGEGAPPGAPQGPNGAPGATGPSGSAVPGSAPVAPTGGQGVAAPPANPGAPPATATAGSPGSAAPNGASAASGTAAPPAVPGAPSAAAAGTSGSAAPVAAPPTGATSASGAH